LKIIKAVLKNKISSILFVFTLIISQNIFGQSLGNSPYSSLGLGERLPIGYAENQAMAGIGVASVFGASGLYINNLNPALLARNKFTMFSMGMNGQNKGLKTATESQKSFAMNLNYVNLSFPVKKHWSMGIAIQPYSYTDLSIKSLQISVPSDTTKYLTHFYAKGGINKLSWNNAIEIKELQFGIETSVLFGQIKRTTDSQIQNDGQFYSVNFIDQQNYNGIYYRLGAAWHHMLKKDRYFNVGLVIEPSKNINAERTRTTQTFTNEGIPVTQGDTLPNGVSNTKVMLPSDFKFGISYENSTKYTLFADIGIGKNSQLKNLNGANDGLKDTFTFGLGAEYFPDFTSTKYLKRAVYRIGINTGTSPYSHLKTGEQLKDLNFSLGIGLPLRNSSFMNIGYTAGRRGQKANGGILENYNKISIGFTLIDVWFAKNKMD
jgi:hypothetical protein